MDRLPERPRDPWWVDALIALFVIGVMVGTVYLVTGGQLW